MTILKKLWRIALLINILSLLEPLFSGNTNHLISYWISYGGVSTPFYVFFCLITTIKGKDENSSITYNNKRQRTWNEKWANGYKFIFFHAVLSMYNRIFHRKNSRHHRSNSRDIHACDVRYAFPWISRTSTWRKRKGLVTSPFLKEKVWSI